MNNTDIKYCGITEGETGHKLLIAIITWLNINHQLPDTQTLLHYP